MVSDVVSRILISAHPQVEHGNPAPPSTPQNPPPPPQHPANHPPPTIPNAPNHSCPFWWVCLTQRAIPGLPGGSIIYQGNPSIFHQGHLWQASPTPLPQPSPSPPPSSHPSTTPRPWGALFGCFGRTIAGDSWFTWWLNHPPGNPSVSPKRATYAHPNPTPPHPPSNPHPPTTPRP